MSTPDQIDSLTWMRLTLTPGIGRAQARRLLAQFGSPNALFELSESTLSASFPAKQAQALCAMPPEWLQHVERLQGWLANTQRDAVPRRLITLGDPSYPSLLLHTQDPPLMLYAMGRGLDSCDPQELKCISVVGSRQPTRQGQENAYQFSHALSAAGYTIVSGMAEGIDAAAHEAALDAAPSDHPGTIAIVGTGLDRVYPKKHHALARRIADRGILLSEYPLGAPPLARHFPQRNRIISGLSLGTLVVEAAVASGSLITARMATEQGRDVFAIPGSIHAPQAQGCHWLIRQGAILTASPQDILDELHPSLSVRSQQPQKSLPAPINETSHLPKELQALGHGPVELDTLVATTGITASQWQAWLLDWELEGWVERLPGGRFQQLFQA